MNIAPTQAEQITRASKSNLALAFVALPTDRRRDASVFYAFCRVIDDIVDDPGVAPEARRKALDEWKRALSAPVEGEPSLAAPVRELIAKYDLPVAHFLDIIAGCEMDLDGTRFETWEQLRLYCHRVASVVGLVSLEIFGARDPRTKNYALDLGLALQLTNILRDVGEDFANGRIYLPRDEMRRFGVTEETIATGRRDEAFLQLMDFEAARALEFYRSAKNSLPAGDRRAMAPAEIMRHVYGTLLRRMQRDRFRVFGRRYRLGKLAKLACIARVLVLGR